MPKRTILDLGGAGHADDDHSAVRRKIGAGLKRSSASAQERIDRLVSGMLERGEGPSSLLHVLRDPTSHESDANYADPGLGPLMRHRFLSLLLWYAVVPATTLRARHASVSSGAPRLWRQLKLG